MTLVLRYAARSDRGLVRGNNEDSVYAGSRLLALADGMGGHAAGEVASQLMIEAMAHLDEDEPGSDLLGQLADAMREGNAAIAYQVEADPELEGMGTTLTSILFAGSRLGLAHVGDSRAYLLRDDELTQITRDDTFVQSLVDEGRITREQAHTHPQRSLIMKALTGNDVEPTLVVREARAGDRYLLCSDGLSDVVSDETIANTMRTGTQDECADRLIELALRSGGPDNITVVVADVIDQDYGPTHPIVAGAVSGDDEDTPPPNTAAGRAAAIRPPRAPSPKRTPIVAEAAPRKSRRKLWIIVAIVALILLVAGGVVGYRLIRDNYYVGERDGQIVVIRGVNGSLLGYSFNDVYERVCVDNADHLTLVDAGSTGQPGCRLLQVSDLTEAAQLKVTSGLGNGSYSNAKQVVANLASSDNLLRICPPAKQPSTPESPRTGTPSPTGSSGEPVPPTSIAPAPTPAVTTTPAPTTTAPGTPTSQPPMSGGPSGHTPVAKCRPSA